MPANTHRRSRVKRCGRTGATGAAEAVTRVGGERRRTGASRGGRRRSRSRRASCHSAARGCVSARAAQGGLSGPRAGCAGRRGVPSAGRSAERGREGCAGRRVRRGKERAGRTVQSGLVVRRYSRAKGTAQHRGVRQPELLRAGYQGRISGYQAIWQGMRAYRAAAGRAEAEAAPSQEEAQSDHVTCRSPLFPARKSGGRRGRRCAAGVWAPDRGCAGAKGQRARRRATTALSTC